MNRTALLLLFGLSACGQAATVVPEKKLEPDQPTIPLTLTAGELSAKASLEKFALARQQLENLERQVNEAMQVVLIDPFSAQYRELRKGKNGSICGQMNGKNRLGAYVGFKDFVLESDKKTVYISRQSDGVETEMYSYFADSFVKNCATRLQAARYKAATTPIYGHATSEEVAQGARDAAQAAAEAAAENVEMPAEEASKYW